MTSPARRAQQIQAFHVMDILAQAQQRATAGESIIHLEIGEPDFPTPSAIVQAGIAALQAGHTFYTSSLGLPALRSAIAAHYALPSIDAERIIVTPGSSGALWLALAALLDDGDEVLLPDPGYPCNRNFVTMLGANAVLIPVDAKNHYQLTPEQIAQYWTARTKVVLIASPANPTGAVIDAASMRTIIDTVTARGGHVIVDEIYRGLIYDQNDTPRNNILSAAALSDAVYVVNSFSKYHGMTGWRIGWLLAPRAHMPTLDRLAQNFFLAANTPGQYASLAAFTPEVSQELERRRALFAQRRDYFVPALRALGFDIPQMPQGAFYVYADCSRFSSDSRQFARDVLAHTGVAITPGIDFGQYRASTHVRFAYANTQENLVEAVRRIGAYLRR